MVNLFAQVIQKYWCNFFQVLPTFNLFNCISFLVREKYSLDVDAEIRLEDEEGAEIDEEVFPVLLVQTVIPSIIFKIQGDFPAEATSSSVSSNVNCGKNHFLIMANL